MSLRTVPALLLSCVLLGAIPACSFGDFGEGLGHSLACAFDLGPFAVIKSDKEVMRASVDCSEGSDCSDRRTIQRGAVIDFTIEIRSDLAKGPFEVRSEPDGLMEIDGFSDDPEQCDDGREISGTITFSQVGGGAFVVFSDGEELDRFSVDVQEPSLLEIQFSQSGPFGEFETLDPISLEGEGSLRAIVRGPSGDRLVAGPPAQWAVTVAEVASFQDNKASASGAVVPFYPVGAGQSTVHASVDNLEQEVAVVVPSAQGMGGAAGQ